MEKSTFYKKNSTKKASYLKKYPKKTNKTKKTKKRNLLDDLRYNIIC